MFISALNNSSIGNDEQIQQNDSISIPSFIPTTSFIPDTSLSSSQDNLDWFEKIKQLKQKNPNNLTCSYLNINSIRNKFHNFFDMIDQNIDIICLAETKLDNSFPASNFRMPGYTSPFRLDINSRSGGLLVYIKETIPSKELKQFIIPKDLQILPIEINLRKSKWLIIPTYRPPSTPENYFLDHMNKVIEYYSHKYENILTLGDYNMETSCNTMKQFMIGHNFHSLYREPTCFKSKQGRCIDLFLTNKNRSFKFTNAFETGMSDHHLMIYTMFRTTFDKNEPINIRYRSYKNFNSNTFVADLQNSISNITNYNGLEISIVNALNKHAPVKNKVLRSNTKPFINQTLRKAISNRSRLKNIANKTGLESDISKFKKQRNYVTSLNRKTQKSYFRNLNPNDIQSSKSFFKTFKPYFSNKYTLAEKLLLIENNEIISDDSTIAEHFNNYFVHITDALDIKEWPTNAYQIDSILTPTQNAILKYSNHPSILTINDKIESSSIFSFRQVTKKEIEYEIKKLDSSKSNSGDIPIRFIKDYLPFYMDPLHKSYNHAIVSNTCPDLLKLVDVTPVFKKGNKNDITNYRPISVMKAFAIVFERLLFKQLNGFIENKFSPLLCGFRKGHSTQHALIRLLEDWRSQLDNKKVIGTILCDLSKAFDTLPHNLLIAKLNAYGLSHSALEFVKSYLSNRKQRCKVGSTYSSWGDIVSGVPQGSVLGPLLFNIFINDFFFFIKKSSTTNFADDNTLYTYGDTIDEVIQKLEGDIENALYWFDINQMVANPNKFQLMFLGTREKTKLSLNIDGKRCISTSSVTLLGIEIDWKLTFNKHVKIITCNANKKAKALSRLRYKLDTTQKLSLYNSYVLSAFGYCPVIWMFCGKSSNEYINRVQRIALRTIYNDYTSNYDALLNKGQHLKIHEMNKRKLLIEVYKCLNSINPVFLANLFTQKPIRYNLRTSNLLELPNSNTLTYGLKSIVYRGSMAWNNLPDQFKTCKDLNQFKNKLKNHIAIKCTCHLCT